jgi:hypothetical protein
MKEISSCENVIIADADYIDKVAFDLIVNFERILGRRIPPADMARWLDCVALDGGIREGDNKIQVVLIHKKDSKVISNFVPSNFNDDLHEKAFKDHIGEFSISCLPVEDIVNAQDFFLDIVSTICNQKEIHRVMIVPDTDDDTLYINIRFALHRLNQDDKHITVFAMQPMQGGKFQQEILGYSLMNAMGIKAEEIK